VTGLAPAAPGAQDEADGTEFWACPPAPTPLEAATMSEHAIALLLADVDGTLVTQDKVLTEASVAAVHRLHEAGVLFAVTSGRPPRGMSMLIEPLALNTPISAFNGGVIVEPDLTVLEQKVLPEPSIDPIVGLLDTGGLSSWIYRGADWFVRDLDGPHVDQEAATVQFAPRLVESFAGLSEGVAKIVGVSDDASAMDRATAAARDRFGDHVTAAPSQPYYLDVTHPEANKGGVVTYLSARYAVPTARIATIGDMPNDVLMFAKSGLSIAMGNASPQVQRAARRVTTSNENEGFATAVDRFILGDGS
jgi:Cof subfamily protein (haloacid dehalogenase superfamily)